MKICKRKICNAKLSAFEKTQFKDGPEGEKHKKEKQERNENGYGGNNEFVNLHPCR